MGILLVGCPVPELPAGEVGSLTLRLAGSEITNRTVAPPNETRIACCRISGSCPGSFAERNVVGDTFPEGDLAAGA
jgi:hypothetical protein